MSASQEPVIVATQRAIVERALDFIGHRSAVDIKSFEQRVTELVSHAPEEELLRVAERVQNTGSDWNYNPPERFARQVHYAMADFALSSESMLLDAHNLETVGRRAPAVFLANHLSFADANLFEILLHRAALDHIADRLMVVAGPKVYSDPFRRFSSLCFGTIKTPQSSSLSSGEAIMGAREVARIARETIELALERQKAGDLLMIFAEGTRSRTASMQRTLPAVSRYFRSEEAELLPLGIAGTEKLVPVGDERVHPAVVKIRVGEPILASKLNGLCEGKARLVMDVIGLRIASLLPPEYRGIYGNGAEELDEARAITELL